MEPVPSQHSTTAQGRNEMVATTHEVERKWLVPELPDLRGCPGKDILQGYIGVTSDGTEIRVRQKGDSFFQTIKTDGGLLRREIEISLSKEQFDSLWEATEGRRLEKTRYDIVEEGMLIELDIYHGNLSGLIVAEVEFASVREAEMFSAPSWFGREVTEEKQYKNKQLAMNGLVIDR